LTKRGTTGGHRKILQDLVVRLAKANIAASAKNLGLDLAPAGEALVPFLGKMFLVSNKGVRRQDGKAFQDAAGSVLIHYILSGSRSRPAGEFVTFKDLAGPLFSRGSYSSSALELPVIKRFQGRVPELLTMASIYGGRQGGEAGSGAVSLIFNLLPHILLQLIFYDRDDEFPARATLLFDRNATQFVDFEVLAVLVTLFVNDLIKSRYCKGGNRQTKPDK